MNTKKFAGLLAEYVLAHPRTPQSQITVLEFARWYNSMEKLRDFDRMTGVQKLRTMTRAFGNCQETFLDNFSIEQLAVLYRMWHSSDWDIPPDQWEERQVQEALAGIPPRWLTEGNPFYMEKR